MGRLVWTAIARSQLRAHFDRIAHESLNAAEKWLDKIFRSLQLVDDFPDIGSPLEELPLDNFRDKIVGNYRVIYRLDGLQCTIIAILRAEQDLENAIDPDNFKS